MTKATEEPSTGKVFLTALLISLFISGVVLIVIFHVNAKDRVYSIPYKVILTGTCAETSTATLVCPVKTYNEEYGEEYQKTNTPVLLGQTIYKLCNVVDNVHRCKVLLSTKPTGN